ncbi:MAG: hypothetical protein HYR74_03965 [Candidatus Eisenbacteria bacterium]|nr:hypothetical protein [Candidatus Eisenbacteria bacterium]
MKQGRKFLSLAVTLALLTGAAMPLAAAHAAGKSAAGTSSKSRNGLRQFSGVVTAFDKTTLTVEKGGKKPESRVFTKHAELRTTGDLEKDARVTVYYRDENGHAVAHRVVVKKNADDSTTDR